MLLVYLSFFCIVSSLTPLGYGGYWPGMGAIFAGALLAVIVVKIGRPNIYFDWLFIAVVQVALGYALAGDPYLSSGFSKVLFLLMFVLLGLAKICAGAVIRSTKGSAAIMASGLTCIACAAVLSGDLLTFRLLKPDFVMATDMMLSGVALIYFGRALRPDKT